MCIEKKNAILVLYPVDLNYILIRFLIIITIGVTSERHDISWSMSLKQVIKDKLLLDIIIGCRRLGDWMK